MNTFMDKVMFTNKEYDENGQMRTPTAQEQLKTRPRIDDVICHNLDGSTLKEALFVIDNIRENKMKIKWSAINVWSVEYKRKHVCDLRIKNGSLIIGKVSDILITRVKNLSYNPQTANPLLDAIIDMVNGEKQEAYAMQ